MGQRSLPLKEPTAEEFVELMKGYQAGDPACFDRLYDLLLPALRGYLIALTRRVDTADDLLQETFLQLHRSRRTYAPPRPVRAWAFGIARNVYLMGQRTLARRHEVAVLDESSLDTVVASSASQILERDLVERALGKLTPEQSEVVILHHVWGFSFREIARILGCSSTAAKVRAHRTMKQLRIILDRLEKRDASA